jgi:Protein of unknown function (DUF3987)/Primase C terminal 2 (PriCT-2)
MVVELRSTGTQTVFPGSTHPGGEAIEWHSDGEPAEIDPEKLLAAVSGLADWVAILVDASTASPAGNDDRNDRDIALSALAALNPSRADCRHEWITVGMALHSVGDDLFDAWDQWSQSSKKYKAGECEKIWRGFGRRQGVTLGTLIYLARQDGWQLPHERNGKGKHPIATPSATKPAKTKRRPVPLEPYKPFPVEVLPEPVRSFTAEASTAIGCDPSFVGLPTLACLSRAIGNTRTILLKRDWQEPSIVWAATVGTSGTHKSPAIRVAVKSLERVPAKAFADHKEAKKEYAKEILRYEKDLAAWKKSKGGDEPPEKPEEPVCQRYIVDNITIEALANRLSKQVDGVLVVKDELAGWIGGIGEYKKGKGSDNGHWLACWSASPTTVDRKTGDETLHIPRASVSIVGGIQPGVLAEAMRHEHMQDGMCARILLAMPADREIRWSEAEIDEATELAMQGLYAKLLTLEPAVNRSDESAGFQPVPLTLTPEAKRAWVDYFNRHRAEMVGLDEDLRSAWSKLEAYTARSALIFQLVSWAAGDAPGDAVDESAVRAAIVLSDWFGGEAKRVYGMFGESEDDRDRRELPELIRRKGGAITARELMRCSRRYPTSEDADAALEALAKTGAGYWEHERQGPEGGRPLRRLRLIDAVDADTTPQNAGAGEVSSTSTPSTEDDCEWTG